jgi:hypothetical protein
MTTKLDKVLLNSPLPNFNKVFTLIQLNNYLNLVDWLLDYNRTIYVMTLTLGS